MSNTADEKIIKEAQERFRKCEEWEREARVRHLDDLKFCEGDSENNYQWDNGVRTKRMGEKRPCLTINKVRQHCLQIVNDARQHKASINIRPVGDGATYEAAKVFEGVVRHIEYISNATEAYESAIWRQVTAGWGYWRVLTDYCDEKSFDQEIFIRRVADPLSVYLDPDIQQFDGSDARFGFVIQEIPRDRYELENPKFKDEGDAAFAPIDGWDDRDQVRVAEYYRKSEKKDWLLVVNDENGQPQLLIESEIGKEARKAIPDDLIIQKRETVRPEIEWFKIAGRTIIERNIWLGAYIPLVRCIGEETVIEGKMDRKGHTRALKDSQRKYNYHSSASVEYVAGLSKSPFVLPLASIEGLESYWNDANTETRPYLPYNHLDADGSPLPAPSKQPAPQGSTAYAQLMHDAQMELMMASGQYQSQMGENENAKSGVAIQTRQRQGDNATYHYIDHQAQAIRYTGRILIDLIPKVYDTPRLIKIMAENGDQTEVHLDPNAQAPMQHMIGDQPVSPEKAEQAQKDPDQEADVKIIFNPGVGKYFVQADVGPSYGTKREETFNALTQMMAQNGDLVKIAGDILFRAADFDMADELAERFKRTIPPNILGSGPPPEVAAMQQEFDARMQQAHGMIAHLMKESADKDTKLSSKEAETDTKTYDSETKRLAVIGQNDPEGLRLIIRSMIADMIGMDPLPAIAAHEHAQLVAMPGAPMAAPEQQEAPSQDASQQVPAPGL